MPGRLASVRSESHSDNSTGPSVRMVVGLFLMIGMLVLMPAEILVAVLVTVSRIGAVVMGMGVIVFVPVRVFMRVLVGVFGSILVGMIMLVLMLVVMSVFVAVFMVTFHSISPWFNVARTLRYMGAGRMDRLNASAETGPSARGSPFHRTTAGTVPVQAWS